MLKKTIKKHDHHKKFEKKLTRLPGIEHGMQGGSDICYLWWPSFFSDHATFSPTIRGPTTLGKTFLLNRIEKKFSDIFNEYLRKS